MIKTPMVETPMVETLMPQERPRKVLTVDFNPGSKISGRYEIKGLVAKGGMGAIYLSYDAVMYRDVIIKVILPEFSHHPEVVKRFIREVRLTSQIEHPNIITLYNFGRTDEGMLFIVMEHINGESLSKLLKRDRYLQVKTVINIAAQIAAALTDAHNKGVIHRDLKPSNIMLFEKGNMKHFVKVLDFGIAKSLEQDDVLHTRKGILLGTPAFMAPEQLLGRQVDHRSDIYSLAIVTYLMLTGMRPYDTSDASKLMKYYIDDIPPSLIMKKQFDATRQVLLKALAKDPENRYNDPKVFVRELAVSLSCDISIPWF